MSGSFFGTIGISILLLSSVIAPHSSGAQWTMWSVGVAATLALSTLMIGRLLNGNAAPASVAPAWLIAGVGSLDIVVTGGALPGPWAREVNLLPAAIGGVQRTGVFRADLFAAGASGADGGPHVPIQDDSGGAVLGWLHCLRQPDRGRRRPTQLSPSWWAIGFPMAALSSAALSYAGAVDGTGLELMAVCLLLLLTLTIVMLAIRSLCAMTAGVLARVTVETTALRPE